VYRQPVRLASVTTLLETKRGKVLPLPARLARLYGCLRIPVPHARPYVFSNFVSSLDGVVSLSVRGHASGGDISGFNAQDRMVMGLLRAVADVVIIGASTLAADSRQVWTADAVFPALANEYRQLRNALGKSEAPLNVVVCGNAGIDLRLPVFSSGKVPALIVTTSTGARRLRMQHVPDSVEIRTARSRAGIIQARAILDEVCRVNPGKTILVEGGPRLLGDFYAAGLLDEQFLTLAPQIAGRETDDRRLSLVIGKMFAPREPLWGTLTDLRRGSSHLFLRYAFQK